MSTFINGSQEGKPTGEICKVRRDVFCSSCRCGPYKSRKNTGEATGVSLSTVRRILQRSQSGDLNRTPVQRSSWRAHLDAFTLQAIRRIVHTRYLKKGISPTLDVILDEVRTELGSDFGNGTHQYGRSTLYKVLQKMGFRFLKRKSRKPFIYER